MPRARFRKASHTFVCRNKIGEGHTKMMWQGHRHCPANTNPEKDLRTLNPQLVPYLGLTTTPFMKMGWGRIWGRFHISNHMHGEHTKAVSIRVSRLKSVKGVARYRWVKLWHSQKRKFTSLSNYFGKMLKDAESRKRHSRPYPRLAALA